MNRNAVVPGSRPAVRGAVVFVSTLLVLGASKAVRSDDAAELVGSWKLVSYEDREVSGTPVYPYGRAPAGFLVYDATGHMAVQMMKTPMSGGTCLAGQSVASIVGTWKVVRYEDRAADGTVSYPYGEAPVGYFVYDATGHLSVQIMRAPALKSFPGMREGTGDGASYREAFLAYVAYFGTYTVDATKGTVTHHVEGSLRPDYTGTDQVRPFRIEGDRLIIEMRQGQQYLRRELIRVK